MMDSVEERFKKYVKLKESSNKPNRKGGENEKDNQNKTIKESD